MTRICVIYLKRLRPVKIGNVLERSAPCDKGDMRIFPIMASLNFSINSLPRILWLHSQMQNAIPTMRTSVISTSPRLKNATIRDLIFQLDKMQRLQREFNLDKICYINLQWYDWWILSGTLLGQNFGTPWAFHKFFSENENRHKKHIYRFTYLNRFGKFSWRYETPHSNEHTT